MRTKEHVLDAVVVLTMRGYPTTVREIRDYASLSSTSVVWYWLRQLSDEGRVTWEDKKARTIRATGGTG